jgi:ribosomal protein S18 acetylase RimI-like enzyme
LTLPSARCDLPVRVRGYLHEDQACIAWGWLHSYRSSPWARLMHPATYAKTQRVIIETLLSYAQDEKYPTQLLVACSPDDEHQIYGWLCGEMQRPRALLHYVWVKSTFRRQGIASLLVRQLVGDAAVVVSHASDQAVRIVRDNPELRAVFGCSSPTHPLRFNPMLAVNPDFEVAV